MKKTGRILCLAIAGLVGIATTSTRADDSSVAPFVDAQTNAVVSVDMTKVDLDKLDDWRKKAMASTPDSPEKAQQEAEAEKNITQAKDWINKFTAAGGKNLYVVVSLANVFSAGPGAIVVPLPAGANSDAMSKVFMPDGNPPEPAADAGPAAQMASRTAMVGPSMVYSTGPMVKKLQTPSTQPRPDLSDALASGGDAALRIGITPTSIKSLPIYGMMKMQATRQGQEAPFSQPEWDNVTWTSITFRPPPNESGSMVCQCKDGDSATKLAAFFSRKLEESKNDPKAIAQFGDNVTKLAEAAKPVVDGSKVTISVDQNTMDNVVGPMMTKAMTARRGPQGPPPGGPGNGPDGGPGMPPTPDNNGGGM